MAKRGLYRHPKSPFWFLSYTGSDGKRVRESSKTADRAEALRILDDKRGRVARGDVVLPRADKVGFDEAARDMVEEYTANKKRDLQELNGRLVHLTKFFAGKRLATIKPDLVTRYVLSRQSAGAADGTIRNEVDLLVRVFRIAQKNDKVERVPRFERPAAAPARGGFVEDVQFDAIHKKLPTCLRVFATTAYTIGWRKEELLDLQLRGYDTDRGTLTLDPGVAKNKAPRIVRVPASLRALLDGQVAEVKALSLKQGRVIPWLFPHLEPHPRAGQHQVDPRLAWAKACRAAGVPGLLIHDLRRSAVRNMEQAGVPRSIAMKITGHKTEAIYKRYAVSNEGDMDRAAQLLEIRAASSRRKA